MTAASFSDRNALRRNIETAISALAARRGEEIARFGPVAIDPVTVSRCWEAIGFPGRSRDHTSVPLTMLALLPRRPIDITRDVRPTENIHESLGNPVNGGTSFTFLRTVRIGEVIYGRERLKEAYVREGRSGPLGIVVKEIRYTNAAGDELGSTEKTTIYRGGVER